MPVTRSRRPIRVAAAVLVLLAALAVSFSVAAAEDDHAAPVDVEHAAEGSHGEDHGDGHAAPSIGEQLSLLWVIPFVGILLSIALGPIINHHWWERNYPKASLLWALGFAVPFCVVFGMKGELSVAVNEILHIYVVDYIPFIILLTGLFVASGGIVLRGSMVGTPLLNVGIIGGGAMLASIIGTTGASMLLIHPLLRANKYRKHRMHIVIVFIFLVSNIGGSLTPLGDPPLFLGFLHGVPFQWTLSLAPAMFFTVAVVLVIFFVMDTVYMKKETAPPPTSDDERQPLGLAGAHNLLFLLGVMGAVLLSGIWRPEAFIIPGTHVHVSPSGIARDVIILLMAVLAFKTTASGLRDENEFSWEPIREVGVLFAGIFMTIIPALAILKAGENGALAAVVRAADSEAAYMWLTGVLSTFLDNAPTYLTFFNTALGQLPEPVVSKYLAESALPFFGTPPADPAIVAGIQEHFKSQFPEIAALDTTELGHSLEEFSTYLKAISIGAVFMGANSYIGNAPNFMVRSIAVHDGVKMPSFFGYMAWSGAILIPVFAVVTIIFLVMM
jgi:Na+/H+ antiporter NhaD/arsenite permease-like protein